MPARDAMTLPDLRRRADQTAAETVELLRRTDPHSPARRRLERLQAMAVGIVADLDAHPHLMPEGRV